MSQDSSLDLAHYGRMLWRRRGVIMLSATVLLCASAVGLQFVPEEYESTATLRMEERRRLSSELEKVIGGARGSGGGYRVDEARLDEMAGRIQSRPFLERVARLLKMNEDPKLLEAAQRDLRLNPGASVDELAIRRVVKKLKTKISFQNTGMGNYAIIVADSDPDHAYLLAKWISELFVDFSLQSSLDELRVAHEFGAEQEKIYQERLRASELALEQYRQATIQTDLSQGFVRAGNSARAEALHSQVLDEVDLCRLRLLPLSRALVDAGLQAAGQVVREDSQVQRQEQAISSELRERATDRAMAGETASQGSWPPEDEYLTLRRGLFRLLERRTVEIHGGESTEMRDLIVRYVFASIDYDTQSDVASYIGAAINDFMRKAQATPRGEMELSRLEAEVETNRTLLGSFRAQLIASDINQAIEVTSLGMRVEVLDPPQVPLKPARPDKAKILVAAILLGPLLGIGIAFGTELTDPTLRTLADFQRAFPGPILGTAPLLSTRLAVPGRGRMRRHWVAATVTCLLVLTVLFFVARTTLLPNITNVSPSIQVIDPGSVMTP